MENNKMFKSCKKLKPWELKEKISYSEWGKLNVDWVNEFKLGFVDIYLTKRKAFDESKENSIIRRSTFGNKSTKSIEKELEKWLNELTGVYNEIELTKQY